ncbi:MAG: GyrI-like domain-containing protein [Maritimibacter sp.]
MLEYTIEEMPEQPYLYLKIDSDYSHLALNVATGFATIAQFLLDRGIRPTGKPMTLMINPPRDQFRMRIGYWVSRDDLDAAEGQIYAGVMPATRSICHQFDSFYSEIPSVYTGMVEYCRKHGLRRGREVWQFYHSHPHGVPQERLKADCHHALLS